MGKEENGKTRGWKCPCASLKKKKKKIDFYTDTKTKLWFKRQMNTILSAKAYEKLK